MQRKELKLYVAFKRLKNFATLVPQKNRLLLYLHIDPAQVAPLPANGRYGPYSDTLRHALNTMEGHFIRGLGDGVVEAEIEPTEDALAEAEAFIAEKQHSELAGQVDRVGRLIDGYQSSCGMELLASVHWVAAHEADVRSLGDAVAAVHAWDDRKRHLMKPEHIASAWKRLGDEGWLVAEPQPRAAS